MPSSQWIVARQRDFRGGETQSLLPETVGRNMLLRMENIILFTTGYLSAIHQSDTQIISNAIQGVCLKPLTGGTYQYYAAAGDDVLTTGVLDTSRVTPLDVSIGTPTSVTGAYIKGISKAVEYLGKWYTVNPNPDDTKNGVMNLTDSTLTILTGRTSEKIRVYANRLWVVNSDGTLMLSDNGDATTWDALNIILLPNSEPVIDFVPIQGGAIVYGKNSIYAMYGTDYKDITFVPLQLGKKLTTGNAEVNGTVFILSSEGIYATSLNGATLLPHNQQDYFQEIISVLVTNPTEIQGVWLQRFNAIMYSWPEADGGSSSLMFYYSLNAYSKCSMLIPSGTPYMLAMNDLHTDFLIGLPTIGAIAKSIYPSNNANTPRTCTLQTRHEDADATRLKVWREFVINTIETVYGVTIEAIQDNDTVTVIDPSAILYPGDNVFFLDIPRSRTISFRLTFNASASYSTALVDELGTVLTDPDGAVFVFSTIPGTFTIREMRVKFRQVGADI